VLEVLERMENEVRHGLVGKALERIREYQAKEEAPFSVQELLSRSCFDDPKNPLCLFNVSRTAGFVITEGPCEFLYMEQLSLSYDSAKFNPVTQFFLMMTDVFFRVTSGVIACIATSVYDAVYALRLFISALPPLNIALSMFSHFVPRLAWLVDWVFVVPKGDFVTFEHLVCFAWRIPSLLLFSTLVALLRASSQEQEHTISIATSYLALAVTFPLSLALGWLIFAWGIVTQLLHAAIALPWLGLCKAAFFLLNLATFVRADGRRYFLGWRLFPRSPFQVEPAVQSGEEEEKKKDE